MNFVRGRYVLACCLALAVCVSAGARQRGVNDESSTEISDLVSGAQTITVADGSGLRR